jgi:iron complex transport system ATP-binding protein
MDIIGRKVSFGYGQKIVLDEINFEIEEGKFTGLLGPNGCGKTTLIGLISGTHHLRHGEISIGGTSAREISARDMAKFLAVVPQFNSINFPFTSLEVVLMGRYPFKDRFGRFSREDIQICLECMAITDTIQFARRPANMLSGGERQRVILARALAQQPKILILDEATSNLDIRHTMSFMAAVRKLSHTNGVTVISAMHDLNLAATFCDEVIMMKDRKIKAMGSVNEVFSQENIEMVYNTPIRVERKNDNALSVHLEVPEVNNLPFLGSPSTRNSERL